VSGDRLPSSRDLVERNRVSPVTVSRAIAALAAAIVRDRPDWTVTSMPTGGLPTAPSSWRAHAGSPAWRGRGQGGEAPHRYGGPDHGGENEQGLA
jgi:DNA-binding transcriptional MocR family regulator